MIVQFLMFFQEQHDDLICALIVLQSHSYAMIVKYSRRYEDELSNIGAHVRSIVSKSISVMLSRLDRTVET